MLERPEFIRQKDIVIVNDVPIRSEIANELPYSATSNLNLFKALRRGTVDTYGEAAPNPYPIKQRDIHATYLDYTYYGEGEVENNWDYTGEICKKKDLEYRDGAFYREEISYYALPHQKDTYISERLWRHINSLVDEIRQAEPKLIVLTGKWSLFFLTGLVTLTTTQSKPGKQVVFGGISTYRASILRIHECWGIAHECLIYPIYHPVHVITMPDKLFMFDLDVQKLCYMYNVIKEKGISYYIKPEKEFIIGDSFTKIQDYFNELFTLLDVAKTVISIDIETFFSSTIDCIGFTYEIDRAICVPFATKSNPVLWSKERELDILCLIYKVLTHPNCEMLCQNGAYEQQFFFKLWKLRIPLAHDTMIKSHVLRNYMPKSLDFLASLYTEHYTFWKHMQSFKKDK